ncbi:LCP family protein [Mycetocola tolaasinivorans]|uniref:LCP family protein n=1 Tax=Mycetocola tolaasinivorans TaxID=76635 RepID=UPI00160409FE|nr:LCP family protein [Mycetocola tolaasinivorans]
MRWGWQRITVISLCGVLGLGLIGAGASALTVVNLLQRVGNNAVDITPDDDTNDDLGEISGGFNLLVVGVDNTDDQDTSFGPRDATLNDVNILLHVNSDHSGATAVSIPRDLIVDHPACTDAAGTAFAPRTGAPFNVAHGRGGLACVVATAEKLTGLSIGYAAEVGFEAVIGITDAIGGVPVCLTKPLRDPAAHVDLPAGIVEIKGADALGFLRSRYGVGDGSDLSRISSQQQYMSSLMRKVQTDSALTNPFKLLALADVITSSARLSTTMARPETLVQMANVLRKLDLTSVAFVQFPGTTEDPRYPQKVVPVRAAAERLFADIAADRLITPDTSTLGPGAIEVPSDAPSDAATPPAETPVTEAGGETPGAPGDGGTEPVIQTGVRGITADQETCTVPR